MIGHKNRCFTRKHVVGRITCGICRGLLESFRDTGRTRRHAQTHREVKVRWRAVRVRRQKVPRKLAEEGISEPIHGYQDGLTVYELADQFGIHRETVSVVLRREGVPRRRRPLSPPQIERASFLHKSDWSFVRVGAEDACDASTGYWTLAKIGKEAARE